MSGSVTGHSSRVALDVEGGKVRAERCDTPLKRARIECDNEQLEGRKRAGPSRSHYRHHRERRQHVSSKGKHKHKNSGSQPSSSKPQTLPVASSPTSSSSSNVPPLTPIPVSEPTPVVINLCTPSPDDSRGQASVITVPETPPQEQQGSEQSLRTVLISSSLVTDVDRSTSGNSQLGQLGYEGLHLPERTDEDETLHGLFLRRRRNNIRSHGNDHRHDDPSGMGPTQPPPFQLRFEEPGVQRAPTQPPPIQLRFEEPGVQRAYRSPTSASSSDSLGMAGSPDVGNIHTSTSGFSGLRDGQRRSAFTPVSPPRTLLPPTSGPNGLGFVLASTLLPPPSPVYPFSHSSGSPHSTAASQPLPYTTSFSTSSPLAPTSYGSREYWSSLASQLDQGTAFITSHSASRRATGAVAGTVPPPLTTPHTGLVSAPIPTPFRAHSSSPPLYTIPRPTVYTHPYPSPVSVSQDDSSVHDYPLTSAFASRLVPPHSMTTLTSEVSPTSMPPRPPRYVSFPSQPGGTFIRHFGPLSSSRNSSTGPTTRASAANNLISTMNARSLQNSRARVFELSERHFADEPSLNVDGSSSGDSPMGPGTSHGAASSVTRSIGRSEVDVIVVVDSSDEDDDVIIDGVVPPRPGARTERPREFGRRRSQQIAQDEEYARQLQSQFNQEQSALNRHFPATAHLWSSTGPSGVVPAGPSIPSQPPGLHLRPGDVGERRNSSRVTEDNFDALASRVHAWTAADARRFLHVTTHRGGRRTRRPRTRQDFMGAVMDLSPSVLYRAIMTSPFRGGSSYEDLLELAERLGPARSQGLTKEAIDSLPVKEFTDKSSDNTNCVVCMCDYEEKERVRTLPCLHGFHQNCIDSWLKDHCTCPICRVIIRP